MTIQKTLTRQSAPRTAGAKPNLIIIHGTRRSANEILPRFAQNNASVPHYLIGEDASVRQFVELQNRASLESDPDTSVSLLFCTGSTGRITDAQMEVATQLLRAIREQCCALFHVTLELNAAVIRLHRHLERAVDCPGPQFPYDALLEKLLPPPIAQYQARLDTRKTRAEAEAQVTELRVLGFKTAVIAEEKGGWFVHMAPHPEKETAENTVRVLRKLGKPASLEKILIPAKPSK